MFKNQPVASSKILWFIFLCSLCVTMAVNSGSVESCSQLEA